MTTIHWTNDFQAACAQADLDHRLILLDFFHRPEAGVNN
jgi:hypothetical protein